ncbi:lysoplasmalogenase [Chitinophaga sp. 30R24]|uniref:lysoplasmalogenase n=1 Tax=Chitinophaga sp. 30R24 TaxID=3248838 RepID=UPI003B8EAF8C
MLRTRSLLIYILILLADILLIVLHRADLRYTTKPLLMVPLVVYVLYAKVKMSWPFRLFLLLALFFSSIGDDLLLHDNLFLPGLASFLFAQIMYLVFFLKIRFSNVPIPSCKYPFIFLNAAAVIVFILFLLPYLGALTLPVVIYAVMLSIMVQSTLHAFHFWRQQAGWYCVAGATLFLASDTLIAIDKFYHPLPGGNIIVMLTYGLAQLGLVYGGISYFPRARNVK